MPRISPGEFRRWFEEVIAPEDEIVVVYSGIWAFGHQFGLRVVEVPRMLLEQMLEVLGPGRTLVLPAYTYAFAGSRRYSPAESAPETGILPQAFLREFPAIRTQSALNSFLCIGPKAEALQPIRGATLWGEGSLKWFFEKHHARMVTLGIPWKDSLGFLHRIEEAAAVPYRYFKTFNGTWAEGGKTQPWAETMFVRSIDVMPYFVWSKVDELLRARARVARAAAPIFMESADAAEIVSTGCELLHDDPYALLANADEVRAWVSKNKVVEIETLRAREPAALGYHDRLMSGTA